MTKAIVFIPLTQGNVTVIDFDDFAIARPWNWRTHRGHDDKPYAARTEHLPEAYAAGMKNVKKTVLLHRELMEAVKGQDVDHENRDTLDNRRENLRLCSRSQNCHNQKIRATNSSGFKGVCWKKGKTLRPWQAYIMCAGKRVHIGYFAEAAEAGQAYNEAAKRLHQDFALLNVVSTLKSESNHNDASR